MAALNLFSIEPGAPFLDALAEAMLAGRFGPVHDPHDPTAMARATLYLPTRRAARAFASCLSARLGGRPLLLPRIVPLGDVDEAETALIGAGGLDAGHAQPIDPLARRMLLTRLVDAWGKSANRGHLKLDPAEPSLVPGTLAEAWGLAGDLAALLDQMQVEGVAVERLAGLDAARFDRLWQLNADFLAIIGMHWSPILAARGESDPADFRNAMLEAERERLRTGPARGPIIAAGSTGTVPATARLLKAIARLPHGAVVLPGLDLSLDEAAWRAIGEEPAPSHPQAALHRLLATIEAGRDDVVPLGAPDAARLARAALLREAMLPAGAAETWAGLDARRAPGEAEAAFAGVTIVEAADERQEALAVAIALRETLETPGRQAALVTPDRGLAERVAVELARWGVAIDDSAGLPLSRWPAGALMRLVLEAALAEFSPATMLDLLAHPLCRLGLAPAILARGAAALEIGAWRGRTVRPGFEGLRASLAGLRPGPEEHHAPRPRRRLTGEDEACAIAVLAALEAALSPLAAALTAQPAMLATASLATRAAVAAVSRTPDGRELAFAGADGEALAGLFDDLDAAREVMPEAGRPRDLVVILEGLMAERVVRRAGGGHPRVKIWGLLEARLLEADHVVLGGLNETAWPPEARTDAFLNRPMRAELGLSAPERRIGQTAHDFVQAALAPQVTLTRARKAGEADTIASRFWQRLKAVTPAPVWAQGVARGGVLAGLASALSLPAALRPVARPKPRPPRDLQPLTLSVTEVETLYRDPYQIFARKILRLDALDELIADPTASDRGTLLHEIVGTFAETYPDALPPDAGALLVAIGDRLFAAFDDTPEVRAFWQPRFRLTAGHYLRWEEARRPDIARIAVERRTEGAFALPDGAVLRLSGRADRVEALRDGRLRIIDFKTGAPPSIKQIDKGYAPQLTLEAELAARAGFDGGGAGRPVPAGPVESVAYVRLRHEAAAWKPPRDRLPEGAALADLAATHLQKLLVHLDALRSGREAYVSRRAPAKTSYVSPYDRLARVKEWAGAADGTEEEA